MVAPTGVNEGLPQESAKAGRTDAEPAGAQVAEAAAGGDIVDSAAAEPGLEEPDREAPERAAAEPAEAAAAEADPAEANRAATELAGAGLGEAGLAEAGLAEAGWDAAEERRDVSLLAVVGIIIGIIALVGAAVGVLAVVTHGFRPKTVVTYRPAAAFGLRPGQCINSGADALKPTVLSCARPHDAEVFAVFTLPAAPWPGTSAVRTDAGDGCASRFGSYVDTQLATAGLAQEFVYPNKAAWQAGERTVVCEVRAVSGQLTNSVRAQG